MIPIDYKISFTTGGLLYREAINTAELYLKTGDWDSVRAQILDGNLLRTRTRSSLIRTSRELIQRLQVLTREQLEILVDGSRQEQNLILWLAVCKQYQFVREFAVEVMREKYLRLDPEIAYRDFDIFFNHKAEWNDDLEKTKESTHKKLRQVLFRMLTEADLISQANHILPILLPPRVAHVIVSDDPSYFTIFPISDSDIKKVTTL
jgi:hypothetical protein